jgi:mono/diheme cytochrome c family protein
MKQMRYLIGSICVIAFSLLADVAVAQQTSRSAGHALARRMCSECHAIERKVAPSPNLDASSFRRIANMRGMTADFLSVEIRRAHQVMPIINLNANDLRDIVAYILSLRRTN